MIKAILYPKFGKPKEVEIHCRAVKVKVPNYAAGKGYTTYDRDLTVITEPLKYDEVDE